jgi:ligand-binding sensor domain-containing protein
LNGQSRVTVLNADGTIAVTLNQQTGLSLPRKAIVFNNDYWIADSTESLTHFNTSLVAQYKLNSPESIATGEIKYVKNNFYATDASVNNSWIAQNIRNGFFYFKENEWTNFNRINRQQFDSLPDFISIAIDNRDESIWAGSFGGGLLHVKADNSLEIFKQNSPIRFDVNEISKYKVSGLAFDNDNNLWVSNFGASFPLHVRKKDGSWKSFSTPFSLPGNRVAQIRIDDNNFKWIVSPLGNGLICFNDNNTIDNLSDDKWKLLSSGGGNGNLPSADVLCVEKDKEGFIWVGTTNGIGVIQCASDIFSPTGCDAILPIVQQGNFADYLFKGEEVRSIATDGANRKWAATKKGVWLISDDGEKVIYNFNESNSPLLSDDVKQITIDGKTGEVFFATANGICSFRSTATDGIEKNENILVFPNPVPPGFSGTIAIRGVLNNAIVKITELNGRLIYQTRALGGQAVWDGKDYRGRRIESGVYLVLISDDGRIQNASTKIIFISK